MARSVHDLDLDRFTLGAEARVDRLADGGAGRLPVTFEPERAGPPA